MPRGSVITGRIVDEFGQPAQGARVRAQLTRVVNGERTMVEVPIAGALFGEAADDRGVYRLCGLPAGEYLISATPRNTGIGDIRRMSESEIRAAEQAIKQPQSPLEPDEPPVTVGYTAVFFPGVLNASQASAITLRSGEERQGVDFAVQFVRTATVEHGRRARITAPGICGTADAAETGWLAGHRRPRRVPGRLSPPRGAGRQVHVHRRRPGFLHSERTHERPGGHSVVGECQRRC